VAAASAAWANHETAALVAAERREADRVIIDGFL